MDVHPPHEAIHNWRQFLLHLLTITIGLLIALALEHWAEYLHERHLVHEAESRIRLEIDSNHQQLADHVQVLRKQEEELKGDISTLQLYASHHQGTGRHSVILNFSGITLHNTAWETARTDGALSYMSYEEAQKIADVYAAQDLFESFERESVADTAAALAHFTASNPDDLDHWTQQQYETAMERIGHVQAQLMLVNAGAKAALEAEQEYLKNSK